MSVAQSQLDYLFALYNGYTAVAERVDPSLLQEIHLPTPLDEYIDAWVKTGQDVVLTGNPGDGKTHLINILIQQGKLGSGYPERDASQKHVDDILHTWQQKRQNNVPFILAINHAPLRHLASEAERYSGLQDVQGILKKIDNLVYYNEPPMDAMPSLKLIDLSQRELLEARVVTSLAKKLSTFARSTPCTSCSPRRCPLEYNAAALDNDVILGNLVALLGLVARRGIHTTMRDLAGLLSFIITGGRSCANRWQPSIENPDASVPTFEDYAYYNLLFAGRSKLFDAIRSTFDPAEYAEPRTDLALWKGTMNQGWLLRDPVVAQPSTLQDLRRLKRRYFFEHNQDVQTLLERMLPTTERNFDALVAGNRDEREAVEELVGMINLLYAPLRHDAQTDFKYRLRLWNSHRYSVGSVPGYVAMRSIPSDNLTIYWPQLTRELDNAINIRQDHVMLAVRRWRPGDAALRVDWPMYHSLTAAREGTPIDVQPFHILRRLDLFLRSLGSEAGGTRDVETIEWSDHRGRAPVRVRISRSLRRYEE